MDPLQEIKVELAVIKTDIAWIKTWLPRLLLVILGLIGVDKVEGLKDMLAALAAGLVGV